LLFRGISSACRVLNEVMYCKGKSHYFYFRNFVKRWS